jgi:hypothetical protein
LTMDITSPVAERIVRERMMAMSGEERFLVGVGMFEAARTIVLASAPQGMSSSDLRLFLLPRFYGADFTPYLLQEIEEPMAEGDEVC